MEGLSDLFRVTSRNIYVEVELMEIEFPSK